MARRVVITSYGVVSSLGCSEEEIMESLKNGRVSFARPGFDDDVVTSPVERFSLKDYLGRFKNSRYLTRGAQFSVAAAQVAARHAGISVRKWAECGLFVGAGPNLDISGEFTGFHKGSIDAEDQPALWMLRFLPNTAASAIAQVTGVHGENGTIMTACAASLQAIGEAFRKVRDGYLDLALAGGGDSRINPGGVLAYKKAQALYNGAGVPEQASRPFDRKRKGFIPGEGGAFFLLEELEQARQRGAYIFGEISGFGNSLDGETMTAPVVKGTWAEQAVRSAFREAGISPSMVDLVHAHGTGTLLNDEMECNLIDRIYGEHKPMVTALKSWIGHLSAACGAVELAVTLICMKNGYLPEIRNLDDPCSTDINFVREGRADNFQTAVIQNFGFGGQNCALVVKQWNE